LIETRCSPFFFPFLFRSGHFLSLLSGFQRRYMTAFSPSFTVFFLPSSCDLWSQRPSFALFKGIAHPPWDFVDEPHWSLFRHHSSDGSLLAFPLSETFHSSSPSCSESCGLPVFQKARARSPKRNVSHIPSAVWDPFPPLLSPSFYFLGSFGCDLHVSALPFFLFKRPQTDSLIAVRSWLLTSQRVRELPPPPSPPRTP